MHATLLICLDEYYTSTNSQFVPKWELGQQQEKAEGKRKRREREVEGAKEEGLKKVKKKREKGWKCNSRNENVNQKVRQWMDGMDG